MRIHQSLDAQGIATLCPCGTRLFASSARCRLFQSATGRSLEEVVRRPLEDHPMKWQRLKRFRDRRVAKLYNLRLASAAGLRVPRTWWLPADRIEPADKIDPPPRLRSGPWIVRSASPTEDTSTGSRAGQFLSRPV